jgi:hypothetical protein
MIAQKRSSSRDSSPHKTPKKAKTIRTHRGTRGRGDLRNGFMRHGRVHGMLERLSREQKGETTATGPLIKCGKLGQF